MSARTGSGPRGGRRWLCACFALSFACAKPGVQSDTPPSARPAATEPSPIASAPAPAASAAAPSPVASLEPTAQAPAASAEGPPSSAAADFSTKLEGCLAATGGEELATRFPADTRSSPSGVRLESEPGHVRVIHSLGHACCLKGETKLERSDGLLRLNERLSGSPCRCRCSSALTTRIRLLPSDRELSVQLDDMGRSSEVYRGPLPAVAAAPDTPKPSKLQVKPKTK